MAFEDVQVAISMMLLQMSNQPEDKYELEILLREKLKELRAFGMPLPQDLVELEATLDAELVVGEPPEPDKL